MKTIDLVKSVSSNGLDASMYGNPPDGSLVTGLAEFLRTGKANHKCGKFVFLSVEECDATDLEGHLLLRPIKSKAVVGEIFFSEDSTHYSMPSDSDPPDAILVRHGKEVVFLCSGDENADDYLEYIGNNFKSATISFNCLAEMFKIKGTNRWKSVIKLFCNEGIKLVDFTIDERIPASLAELELVHKKKVPNPPAFGFTLTGRNWHRPAWTCFKDKTGDFYIMGQDEGSYFCSQLPPIKKKSISCEEALRTLVPPTAKLSDPRQGEWFAVLAKKVPEIPECDFFADEVDGCVTLPVEDATSNYHIFTGTFRVKGEEIYVRYGELVHPEHSSLTLPGDPWYQLVRNTARRSVSVEGVD